MPSNRKIIFSWCMYDWANSAFATTIMAAVLPTFYSKVAGAHLQPNIASAYWGYTVSIAMITGAILAPILGAIADHTGARKRFMGAFALFGSVATALVADRAERAGCANLRARAGDSRTDCRTSSRAVAGRAAQGLAFA